MGTMGTAPDSDTGQRQRAHGAAEPGRGPVQVPGRPAAFEEDLARLEEIVHLLDAGSIHLDDSLLLYEEAVTLVAGCRQRLDVAATRVAVLEGGPALPGRPATGQAPVTPTGGAAGPT